MRPVLVLRPEPGASATVKRAREGGLDARSVPLFEVTAVDWTAPESAGFDALLLTSANAVRHAGDGLLALRGLPVHAVGEATARAAREAGFDIASSGDSGVDRLLGSIGADLKLLHLCGEETAAPTEPRQRIQRVVIYRADALEKPDLGSVAGAVALVHSPAAARRLAELMPERSATIIAAISDAAAEAAGGGWEKVEAAEQPTDDALLALASRLCNKPQPE